MLKITNTNDFDLKDRYNGEDYVFPAGKTMRCDELVARHIFGFGEQDKTRAFVRQGWMKSMADKVLADAVFAKFKFDMMDEGPTDDLARVDHGKAPVNAAADKDEPADHGTKLPAAAPSIPKRKQYNKKMKPPKSKGRSVLAGLAPSQEPAAA